MELKKLQTPDLLLGEGPVWDAHNQILYWVDIEAKKLYWLTGDQEVHLRQFTQRVSLVSLTESGQIVVALEDGIYKLDGPSMAQLYQNPEESGDSRFNDGKCDALGRLWAGTMRISGLQGQSAFYKFEGNHSPVQILDSISISNGLAFTRDNKHMYYIDTPAGQLWRFDFDLENGTITNKTAWIDGTQERGLFDGMTIDCDDNLWVCHWGGGCVTKWDGRTGKKIMQIEMPRQNVTCCTFGGQDMNRLFITTADSENGPGGVYYLDTDTRGPECYRMGLRQKI